VDTAVAGSVVAGVEVLGIKAEEASVSTQTADPEGRRTDLVGTALQEMDTEVVVVVATGAEVEVSGHLEVGMEVGTVPTSNGRAQGWTRIAIQSDQGIDSYFEWCPTGSHHGVSLPERFFFYLSTFSFVTLLSLPLTCCVSIQCFLAAVRKSP